MNTLPRPGVSKSICVERACRPYDNACRRATAVNRTLPERNARRRSLGGVGGAAGTGIGLAWARRRSGPRGEYQQRFPDRVEVIARAFRKRRNIVTPTGPRNPGNPRRPERNHAVSSLSDPSVPAAPGSRRPTCRASPSMKCCDCWAAAAWASSTWPGRTTQSPRRAQDDPRRAVGRAGSRARFAAEARPWPAAASEHRADLRGRRADGSRLLAGVRRGRQPGLASSTARPQPPREAADLVETLARAMHSAHRRRHHPSRSEAGQRPADGRRYSRRSPTSAWPSSLAEDAGQTQTGQIMGTPSYMHRAGGRRHHGHRPRHGCLRARSDPLRAADGPPAVPRRQHPRHAGAGGARRPGAAAHAATEPAARPGNRLPEVPRQRTRPTLLTPPWPWLRISNASRWAQRSWPAARDSAIGSVRCAANPPSLSRYWSSPWLSPSATPFT